MGRSHTRGNQALHGQADQIGSLVSKERGHLRAGVHHAALMVDDENGIGGGFECQLEAGVCRRHWSHLDGSSSGQSVQAVASSGAC
jgi:hypothetical protein